MKTILTIFAFLWIGFLTAQNLVDTSGWTVGSTPPSGYSFGASGESSIVSRTGPHGAPNKIMLSFTGNGSGNDGGLTQNAPGISIDHTKTYRITSWVKREATSGHFLHMGIRAFDSSANPVTQGLDGSDKGWNAWMVKGNAPEANKWYLMVAYLRPSNYPLNGLDESGLYSLETGQKVTAVSSDLRTTPAAVSIRYLFSQYDNPNSGEEVLFYDPQIYDTSDSGMPSLSQLLNPGGSGPDCSAFTTEYQLNGSWQSGANSLTLNAGDNIVLSALPNSETITITTPSGQSQGDNFSISGFSASDAGNYTITSSTGCTLQLSLTLSGSSGSGNAGNTVWTENAGNIHFDTGNVGIGTSSPDSKLAVNGNIRAKEIKVETSNWPDYVFQEGYDLPTLEEIQQHIQEKGHLPNIPSAQEVEANGLELGEMNKLLLEKIEELTLHIIQLQCKINHINKKYRINLKKGVVSR